MTDRAPNSWVDKLARFLGTQADTRRTTPSVDGETIRLPESLDAPNGVASAVSRYRILAIEQAERIVRGTPSHLPTADPLERDLYLLREGMAIDAELARRHPGGGFVTALSAERESALERRPMLSSLSPQERDVELLLRDALRADAAAGSREATTEEVATPGLVTRVGTRGGIPHSPTRRTLSRPSADAALGHGRRRGGHSRIRQSV